MPIRSPLNTIEWADMNGNMGLHFPDEEPYVKIGDSVKAGQKLGFIEAMGTINPIVASCDGIIISIIAANEQPIEYGQALFEIKPD